MHENKGVCQNYTGCSLAKSGEMQFVESNLDPICRECKRELKLKIRKTGVGRLAPFFAVLTAIILILGGIYIYFYIEDKRELNSAIVQFKKAITDKNLSSAQEFIEKIKNGDPDFNSCVNCDQELKDLKLNLAHSNLNKKFEEAFQNGDYIAAQSIISEIDLLFTSAGKKCTDCNQNKSRLTKARKLLGLKKQFDHAIRSENVAEAVEFLSEVKLLNPTLDQCINCLSRLDRLIRISYDKLRKSFYSALRSENFKESASILAKTDALFKYSAFSSILEPEVKKIEKAKKYVTTIKQFNAALNSQDLKMVRELFSQIKAVDPDLNNCIGCQKRIDELETKVYVRLKTNFKTAIGKENFEGAKASLEKLIRFDPELKNCPDCTLLLEKFGQLTEERKRFRFKIIKAGEYEIPQRLKPLLCYQGINKQCKVEIDKPFYIQAGEVTIDTFRRFVNRSDEKSPERFDKKWRQKDDGRVLRGNRPVECVTWQEVEEFSKWLSHKTQWNLRLPSYEQWVAACITYGEAKPILFESSDNPQSTLRAEIDHLIGNLREMSSTILPNGKYLLLGENYRTSPLSNDIGKEKSIYKDERWRGVGFRLVKMEN